MTTNYPQIGAKPDTDRVSINHAYYNRTGEGPWLSINGGVAINTDRGSAFHVYDINTPKLYVAGTVGIGPQDDNPYNHATPFVADPPALGVMGKVDINGKVTVNVNRTVPSSAYAPHAPNLYVKGTIGIGTQDPYTNSAAFLLDPPALSVDGKVDLNGKVTINVQRTTSTTTYSPDAPNLYVNGTVGIGSRNPYTQHTAITPGLPALAVEGDANIYRDDGRRLIRLGVSLDMKQDQRRHRAEYDGPWKFHDPKKPARGQTLKKANKKRRSIANKSGFIYDVVKAATGLSLRINSVGAVASNKKYGLSMKWDNDLAGLQLQSIGDAGRKRKDTVLSWGTGYNDLLRFRFIGKRVKNDTKFERVMRRLKNRVGQPGGYDIIAVYPLGVVKVMGAIISYSQGYAK